MKSSKEQFEILCAIANCETERYRHEYDRLKLEKQQIIDNIKKNYVPNTPLFNEKMAELEQKNLDDVSSLRAEYSNSIAKTVDDVREEELYRVQNINETKLNKLKSLSDIPVTSEELLAIIEKYNIDGDYWCNRFICNLAQQNGIDNLDGYIETDYSTKMNILNQILDQATEMVRDYDGQDQREAEKRQRTLYMLLKEDVLTVYKQIWNGEFNATPDDEIVSKAYLTILSKATDIERGIAIANALKNSKGQARNMLLCEIAGEQRISNFAIKLSGFATEIDEFKMGKAEEYRQAQQIVSKMAATDSEERKKEIIEENISNQFLNNLIKAESKRNAMFKKYIAASDETENKNDQVQTSENE